MENSALTVEILTATYYYLALTRIVDIYYTCNIAGRSFSWLLYDAYGLTHHARVRYDTHGLRGGGRGTGVHLKHSHQHIQQSSVAQ